MLLRSTLNPHSIRSTHQHLQTPSSYNYQVQIIKIIKVLGGKRFVAIQASQVIASVAAVLCRERKERSVHKSRKAEEESLTSASANIFLFGGGGYYKELWSF